MKIAIIPARKNSKRIKNKNIKMFVGKPIISYAIKCAKEANMFEKIIVSTDCKKIAKISKKYGAEVPFLRPKKISTDSAKTIDVIKHAINWLNKNKINPKYICCIYPTTPLLKPTDLKKSFLKLNEKKCDFIVPSVKYSHPIERSFEIKNNTIKLFKSKKILSMTQKLTTYYHDAGQFYWGKNSSWINKKNILTSKCSAYKLSNLRALDIDNIEDWTFLEKIFKYN